MSEWTNKNDLIMGFEACEYEIKNLRDSNTIMRAELTMADRILGALESHKPSNRGLVGNGEDVLWKIRQTKDALAKELEVEKQEDKSDGLVRS